MRASYMIEPIRIK